VLPAQKKSHRLTPPKNGPIAGGGAADVAGAGCTGAITSGLFMKVFAQITKLQHDLVVSPTRNTDRRFLVRTVQRVTNPQRIALFSATLATLSTLATFPKHKHDDRGPLRI
jgi:hypothetical protein